MKVDTSLRTSRIILRLYFVVDYERMKFCERNGILPPKNLCGQKLIAWIDRRKKGDKRCKRMISQAATGQLLLNFKPPEY